MGNSGLKTQIIFLFRKDRDLLECRKLLLYTYLYIKSYYFTPLISIL